MGVFKLPQALCDEINSLIDNFLCGSSPKGKKMHWLSWKSLWKSKADGSLDFMSWEILIKL